VKCDYRYTGKFGFVAGVVFANGFVGPFGAETNNPILFVSNTLDPITAIEKYVFPPFTASFPQIGSSGLWY
jgi:hypothetical protein